MLFQRNIAYAAVVCFLVAIAARCVANGLQLSPLEINEQVGNLLQDQENAISQESVIGPLPEETVQPLVFVIVPPTDPTPDPAQAHIALANLGSYLELLKHEQLEARSDLQDHQDRLASVEKLSITAHRSAEEALHQLSSITSALHNSLEVFRHASESSRLADSKLDQQKSHADRASSRFQTVKVQLQEIVSDYEATKKAAEIAAVSAKEAQLIAYGGNDAEAATH